MTERTRKHPIQFYLSDDEQYILDEKFRLSKMRSKSAFLRKLVLYGFVYDVDYSHIREMNALLGNISGNLNQIAKRVNTTNTIYKKDMEDIKELMDQIWQSQKSMVLKQPLIKQYNTSVIRIRLMKRFIFHLLPAPRKPLHLISNIL